MLVLALALGPGPVRAQQRTFGDVTVTLATPYSQLTSHGYLEVRAWVENHSERRARQVRLRLPHLSFGSEGSLKHVERTVMVPPGGRMEVPLWLPPLPILGDDRLVVEVDGREQGWIEIPGLGQHMRQSYFATGTSVGNDSVMLVAHGVNLDRGQSALGSSAGPYWAEQATGPSDAGGLAGGGVWKPDPKSRGPHRLELEFQPTRADHLRLYDMSHYSGTMTGPLVTVVGVSGRTLVQTNMPPKPASATHPTSPVVRELSLGALDEPVRLVRLEFTGPSASDVSVDAVELAGPDGTAWALDARASSEYAIFRASDVCVGRTCVRPAFGLGAWSSHWLSYTPFDAVILGPSDVRALPPRVAEALWRYVECGGNLFVFGELPVPEPWSRLQQTHPSGAKEYPVGLGWCVVMPEDALEKMDHDLLRVRLRELADSSDRFWQTLPRGDTANRALDLGIQTGLSLRWFVLLGLGCVVVLGPVQWLLMWRTGRRSTLLWTLPLLSALTTAGVLMVPVLQEGIQTRVGLEGFTVLDQVQHRASTVAGLGYYSVLPPRDGLSFDEQTELTPLTELDRFVSAGSARRVVDWTRGQTLVGGWIRPRVPAMFLVRKSETRRERLEWEQTGQELQVINGLGTRLVRLRLADPEGRLWEGSDIEAGARATLKPAGRLPTIGVKPVVPADLWREAGFGGFGSWATNRQERLLRPGTYLAELEENPFLGTGLAPGVRTRRMPGLCIVYGIFDPRVQR